MDQEDSESNNDPERAASAKAEIHALKQQLTEGLGLGRRHRTWTSAGERARSNLTKQIATARRNILQHHRPLGTHLERSIETGMSFCYNPEPPIDWVL
jgi:hypothetical protein